MSIGSWLPETFRHCAFQRRAFGFATPDRPMEIPLVRERDHAGQENSV
jgi:hypothetical protein